MKILISVANYAYSFIVQANALAKGFSQNHDENLLLPVNKPEDIIPTLEQFHPDVVITIGNWYDYDLLIKQPLQKGYKVVPWVVADFVQPIKDFIDDCNRLPLILTPSSHCKDTMVKLGLSLEIVKIIPEAVDPDLWYPMSEDELTPFIEHLSIPIVNTFSVNQWNLVKAHQLQIPIIYTTGGDATRKGAQEVIQALGKLDPAIPWIYMIKTWSSVKVFKKSIEELSLAHKLGIENRIRYLVGEFSHTFMRALTNICDIYAAPSRFEGFGLPLVEAQMCAKPVITTEATSTKETVVDKITGYHCKIGKVGPDYVIADVDDLSKHLHTLLTDHQLRHQMGQNALNHARQNYSPLVIARKFLEVINNPGR
jgi:glycosyltransferase involved in cell wall biosynthesis